MDKHQFLITSISVQIITSLLFIHTGGVRVVGADEDRPAGWRKGGAAKSRQESTEIKQLMQQAMNLNDELLVEQVRFYRDQEGNEASMANKAQRIDQIMDSLNQKLRSASDEVKQTYFTDISKYKTSHAPQGNVPRDLVQKSRELLSIRLQKKASSDKDAKSLQETRVQREAGLTSMLLNLRSKKETEAAIETVKERVNGADQKAAGAEALARAAIEKADKAKQEAIDAAATAKRDIAGEITPIKERLGVVEAEKLDKDKLIDEFKLDPDAKALLDTQERLRKRGDTLKNDLANYFGAVAPAAGHAVDSQTLKEKVGALDHAMKAFQVSVAALVPPVPQIDPVLQAKDDLKKIKKDLADVSQAPGLETQILFDTNLPASLQGYFPPRAPGVAYSFMTKKDLLAAVQAKQVGALRTLNAGLLAANAVPPGESPPGTAVKDAIQSLQDEMTTASEKEELGDLIIKHSNNGVLDVAQLQKDLPRIKAISKVRESLNAFSDAFKDDYLQSRLFTKDLEVLKTEMTIAGLEIAQAQEALRRTTEEKLNRTLLGQFVRDQVKKMGVAMACHQYDLEFQKGCTDADAAKGAADVNGILDQIMRQPAHKALEINYRNTVKPGAYKDEWELKSHEPTQAAPGDITQDVLRK